MINRNRSLINANNRPTNRAANEKSKPDTFVSVKKSHDVPRKKEINAIPSIHVPLYTTGNNSFIFFFPDGTSV